eukprot:Gb_11080 [translate_table: standard]
MSAAASTTPSAGGALPLRQSARKRPSAVVARNVSETVRNVSDKSITHEAAILAVEGSDLNLRTGKDFGHGKDFGQEKDYGHGKDFVQEKYFGHDTNLRETILDSHPNAKSPNKANNQAVKKAMKISHRGKSPVRAGGTSKISKLHLMARIFTKWFLLFTFLGGIGHTVWNWTTQSPSTPNPKDFLYEGRVAELEDFLKKTTKMMQVQLELVDMKIGREVEGLRKELEESIEEQTATFYTELRNLKAQTSDIEASLLKLRDSGILTKQDILSLVNFVVDARASEGEGHALSLDDVRAVARRLVEVELEKHAADGLGRVDYALGMGGGRVVQHSEGYFLGNGRSWGFAPLDFLIKNVGSIHPYAAKVLEPSFGEPGQCLPLKGSRVFVDIALRTSIFIEAVTLEHVAKSVAYDRASAPKDFRIFGWLDQQKDDVSEEAQQMFLLGESTYDLVKSSVQTFNLPAESTGKLVNMIKLDVLSNHGSPSHTCIYRLRVHGSEPEIIRPAAIEA